MQTEPDFDLMAENFAAAAMTATDVNERLELVRQSAIWRNAALRVRLGDQAWMLRHNPFEPEQFTAAGGGR